jgi:hypothetical protein
MSDDSAPQFGRRVVYLLDWFAQHLDPSVDHLINSAGHAVLRIGGHLAGLVQVEDTHAHGPMTKIYKKHESLEAYEQLILRPDKFPSTTRQTVLDRALGSWHGVDHSACSRGFVSNGIANKLDGTEDDTFTLEVSPYEEELGMHRLRAKVMGEVAKLVSDGTVTSFDDYKTILEAYDAHTALVEGQEAFGQVVVDGDEADVADATDEDNCDTDRDDDDDDDDDEGPPGGGGGLGGGGHEDLPPPSPPPPAPGEPHDDEAEPAFPPPAAPPPGLALAALNQAVAMLSKVTHPLME